MPSKPPQTNKPDAGASKAAKNEYIPNFIAAKPFYVPSDGDSGSDYLEHQRLQKVEDDSLQAQKWYSRGIKQGPAATKFRKGACENCGAMSHKAKDCLSRPRKQGAKWTGRDIQADEVLQDVNLGYDAKRDRWNGYDATEYQAVVEEYNELEALQRNRKAEGGDGDEGEEGEGDRYEEETDMGRQQSTSTRNLRLREDTAKYLLNLDLDSAKYDPKTRSMVDSGATADEAAALVAEEGFVRKSGDAAEFEKATRYAWETQERGAHNKIHLQANPTSGEYLLKKEQQEADTKKAVHRKALLDKYGDQGKMQSAALKELMITETEKFVEYDKSGGIKGLLKTKLKSKYPEDVLLNNHTSVWGSWWSDFQWGYACCHSATKASYCTGEDGKRAFEEERRLRMGADLGDENLLREPKRVTWREEHEEVSNQDGASRNISDLEIATRKRTIEEMKDGVTEEEMEDYRRKRANASDPMAALLGTDELVR
jgi:pre-mRNA-processing factor SLU7